MRVTNIVHKPNIILYEQTQKSKMQIENLSFKAFYGKIDNSSMAMLKPEVQEMSRNINRNIRQIRKFFKIMEEKNFCAKKVKRLKACYKNYILARGHGYLFQLGKCTALINIPERKSGNFIRIQTKDNKTFEKHYFYIEDDEKVIANSSANNGIPTVKRYMTQEEIKQYEIEEKILLLNTEVQNYATRLKYVMGSGNNGISDVGCLPLAIKEKFNKILENIAKSEDVVNAARKIACSKKISDIKRQYPNYVPIGGLESRNSCCYKYGDKVLLVRESDKYDNVVRIVLKSKKEGDKAEEVFCIENGEKIIRKLPSARYYIPREKDRLYLTQEEIEKSNVIDFINHLERESGAFLEFLQKTDFSPKPRGGYRPRKLGTKTSGLSEQNSQEKQIFLVVDEIDEGSECIESDEQDKMRKHCSEDFDVFASIDEHFEKSKQEIKKSILDIAKKDAKDFAKKLFDDFITEFKNVLVQK